MQTKKAKYIVFDTKHGIFFDGETTSREAAQAHITQLLSSINVGELMWLEFAQHGRTILKLDNYRMEGFIF